MLNLGNYEFIGTREVFLSGKDDRKSPDSNKIWVVLGGAVKHITGTATAFDMKRSQTEYGMRMAYVPSANANMTVPFPQHSFKPNAADSEMQVPAFAPWIVSAGYYITIFDGGAGVEASAVVAEYVRKKP